MNLLIAQVIQSRLKRNGITSATAHFGSEEYSQEELVAEIGASMLTGLARFRRCDF